MGLIRLLLGLAAALAIVSFGVKNMEVVRVSYFKMGTYTLPLFYLLMGFFVLGFLLAWLGGLFHRVKSFRTVRRYRRQNRLLENELERVHRQERQLLLEEGGSREAPAAAAPPGAGDSATSE
ncbi:MAG: LapA family protein [bacterium]|nr:LapA family protein [bacterium]